MYTVQYEKPRPLDSDNPFENGPLIHVSEISSHTA